MVTLTRNASSLTFQDSLLTIVGAGLVCHLIFNLFEPRKPLLLAPLLIVAPLLLTSLLLPHYSNVTSSVAISFATYLATLVISVVAYRLSPMHPLAKYPGPLMCKISKLWFAGLAMGGKQHVHYQLIHARYGDVVRIGPNELSFRDPAAIAPMMGTTGMPKGPWWDGRMPEQSKTRTLLGLRDPREHARRRRPWNRAFTTSALKDYEVIIQRRALQFMDALSQRTGRTIDLSQWISWFTYDFMNDMVFGGGSEMMRNQDASGLWHMLENAQPVALFMSHLPWIGEFYVRVPGMGAGLKAFRKYAKERAGIRKMQGSQNKDLFYHLIDEAGIESKPPTFAEVVSDGSPAILAGADTTSTALSNLFWFLLSNPAAYSRLQSEIDGLGDNILDTTRHAHMPYLNAAINETLRLFPPVLSGSQRAPQIGSGGQAIGPHFVPEGTSVIVHTYSLQRDPRNFYPMPDAFLPERWLSPDQQVALEPAIFKGSDQVVHNLQAFIPFSFGPANCVGKNLAYQEMRAVVCLLMQKFDIRFEAGYDVQAWERGLLDFFVTIKGKLPVVIEHRNSL